MEEPRIIVLNGVVDERSAMEVIVRLIDLDKEDPTQEISLYINSPGGSIDFGLAIHDTIKFISAPVSTVCFGVAASMGAFLLSCGAHGRRFALQHSRVLIHQPLVQTGGNVYRPQTRMERLAQSIESSRDELEIIIAENTGKTVEQVHADCERDNWMSAEQAKEYGLIDDILCK